jgi:hypothetical protein
LNGVRADAEEIWQDTFVAAVRAMPGFREESRLSSLLCGIAGVKWPISIVAKEELWSRCRWSRWSGYWT